jgi:DEAD/DEAH box helicase domain-containing protein
MREIILDIESIKSAEEVGGWINKHKMGIAVLCAKYLDTGEEFIFSDGYKRARPLSDLYKFLNKNILIGHNIKTFDYRLIQEEVAKTTNDKLANALVDTAKKKLSLGSISEAMLGTKKQMNGADAPFEWRKGEEGKKKVIDYCMDDVRKTYEVFKMGLKNGYISYMEGGDKFNVDVDWNKKLKEAEVKIIHPVCLGEFRIEKKVWQCSRCPSKVLCKDMMMR